MTPFDYVRADGPDAAVKQVVARPTAAFLGGGTGLIDLMKLYAERHDLLVDVSRLPMDKVEATEKGVRIGANVRNSDLAYHAAIRTRFPVLSEALLSGASPQLRNMATVGGNLMQRTRCPYFRDGHSACNKRVPKSGCAALDGVNRGHAVLGTSDHCIATHPSDLCVALAILDATVRTTGPKGERTIPFADFHRLPGDTPDRETALDHGELITAVDLPALPWATRSHYLKVRDRASYEFALTSAAVALEIADGVIKQARIALGGVGTKPWRAAEAEKALVGKKPTPEAFAAAGDAALAGAVPRQHNAFKIPLAKRTVARALAAAAAMPG
ncbi:FAD binding domain-containing protein [Limnoglobus roseus]|uniref:Xanthine dehydrogenase YagS FAD-binding subunit n=1 Tax=Limnoglobus roseus TaxID=2598579 RepID=A0A5C1ASV9_9BACT|nr:xanthine dehydrogenase family protein subunit M [Limnoglobus roseus]QEL20662.1 Putative xanthine dehydrogenase YagS FAD-binding subunit [Limnoglobus roseus]